MPAMQRYELGLLPFFPLASGLLTGKYKRNAPLPEGTRLANTQRLADRYITEANWPIVEQLAGFAAKRGRSMLELAFSWLRGEADRVERHRRRDQARAGRAERQGGRLGADARRDRGDRQADPERVMWVGGHASPHAQV